MRERTVLKPCEQPLWKAETPDDKEVVFADNMGKVAAVKVNSRATHDDLRVLKSGYAQVVYDVFRFFAV